MFNLELKELITAGKIYDLGKPWFPGMPHHPIHPPFAHVLSKKHGEVMYEVGGNAANDLFTLIGHTGTHLDAVCHISKKGKLFGGADANTVQDYVKGLTKLGIDQTSPINARGNLLDIPKLKGIEVLERGYPVSKEDLQETLELEKISLKPGDVAWMIKKKGIKSMASLHPDDETGYSAGEGSKEAAEKAGLKVLTQEYFPRSTVDFYPILSRIIAKKPDYIDMVFCGFRSVALIAKQLHELNYKGVVVLWTVDPVKALKVIGPEALEGYYSYLTLAKMITPEQERFKKDYEAAYKDWNEQSLLAYDLLFTLTECIEEGQTFDPEKIADIMEDKVIPYLYGKGRYGMEKKFGIKRQGMYPTPLAQFENGNWQHIEFIDPELPR